MYIALLQDEQTVINKSSLELINAIPDTIKYLIKVELDSHVVVGKNEGDLYTYTAVDLDGKYQPIEITNFLVVDIGTDRFGKYANERDTIIKEKHSGISRKFFSVGGADALLRSTLVPLLRELENAGSWVELDKFKELDEVKKENERLSLKVKDLQDKLSSLASE